MNETVDFIAKVLLGVGSIAVAIASFYISKKAKNMAKSSAIGSTLTCCVERYESIMKIKYEAKKGKDAVLAEQYYRELFDLFWTETYLWIDGMIPDYIMRHWIQARASSWEDDDKIRAEKEHDKSVVPKDITYKERWKHAHEKTFKSDQNFINFMNRVHNEDLGSLENAAELRKTKKELKKQLKIE